jgi:hypothetical protein
MIIFGLSSYYAHIIKLVELCVKNQALSSYLLNKQLKNTSHYITLYATQHARTLKRRVETGQKKFINTTLPRNSGDS